MPSPLDPQADSPRRFQRNAEAFGSERRDIEPGGAIDGANTDFTLGDRPREGSLTVYLNGLRLVAEDDWTTAFDAVTGAFTITLATAPAVADVLRVDYRA